MNVDIAKKKAGRISPVLMGDYDNTTSYRRLDWVYYGGTSYICRKRDTLGIPPTDNARWQKIVDVPTELELEFDEAQERENISSGEKLHTILGKIMKYFSDLKEHAFLDPYNDLDETKPGKSLDAVQGKELKTTLNAVTQMLFLDHPTSGTDVYDFIINNHSLFTKSSTVSIMIYSEGGVLGAGEGSGMFLGSLYYNAGNIVSELVNMWNVQQKLSLYMNTYESGKPITFKFVDESCLANKSSILNTQEQISANTSSNNIAGALALKEMNNSLNGKITQLNSDLSRYEYNITAYCTFSYFGDNRWVSNPIPLINADKYNIGISGNIKNSTTENQHVISQSYFTVQKYHDCFYVTTENTSVAGYLFGTVDPGIVWEVPYSVTNL